jgi:hypothetical protein
MEMQNGQSAGYVHGGIDVQNSGASYGYPTRYAQPQVVRPAMNNCNNSCDCNPTRCVQPQIVRPVINNCNNACEYREPRCVQKTRVVKCVSNSCGSYSRNYY